MQHSVTEICAPRDCQRIVHHRAGWLRSFILVGLILLCVLPGGTRALYAQQGTGLPAGTPVHQPDTVYVADFLLPVAPGNSAGRGGPLQVRKRIRDTIDHAGPGNQESPEERAATIVNLLSVTIVGELNERGVYSVRLPSQPRSFAGSWLLEGEFLECHEGSAVKKAVIGFGSGSPEMEVHIVLSESTETGSNVLLDTELAGRKDRKPGAAITKNPYVAGAKFILAKNAPERDVKKLGAQIAGTVYQFMKDQGLAK